MRIEQAFGNINQHEVIDMPSFIKKIKELHTKPNILEWNDVIQILNIALLEKMIGKTEKDMNIESLIEQPTEVGFDDYEKTKIFLEDKLSIQNTVIDIQKPIAFCKNCFLLFDKLNNKYFLSKNNELVFEIEEEYKGWKAFLENIDNQKTIEQLLNSLSIKYATIESLLKIAIEENILAIL